MQITDITASVDPEVSTLVRVQWTQDADADATWLEFELGDDESFASPPTARGAGQHEELILGAPADTELRFVVVAENRGGKTSSAEQTASTGPLPDEIALPTLTSWSPDLTSPEGWLLGSVDVDGGTDYSGPYWLFIVDRQGRVVWYRDVSPTMSMFPRVSRDGSHIVFEQHLFLEPTGASSLIQRMTLDGDYGEEIEAPGLGWCWDETDEGILLYDQNRGVDAVTIQEIAKDGSRTTVWDCTAWLAPYDADPENCYTNTVNWVAATDSILWSTYWGDWVAEVDRQTGAVLWHAGALEDSWSFEPPEASFDLQHYPNYTPDGTLLVSTHVPEWAEQQRAREYVLDETTQSLTEIWSYGEGVEGYAPYSGEAVRLANGNTLLNYGTAGEVREIDPQGATVWSLQWGDELTLGHTQLVGDLYAVNKGP